MDTLAHDVRFAIRSLLRAPTFTIAAVLALGLGVGSTAAVFTLLDAVVLRSLPYERADRLVTIWDVNQEKGLDHEPISPVTFLDERALNGVFQDAAAWWRPQLNLDDGSGDPIRVAAVETTANLFDVLGVRPALGRGFASGGALHDPVPEAVISDRLWRTRFRGDRAMVGRLVRFNGDAYTIVGVMPEGFGFPGATDVWQRMVWDPSHHSRGAHFMEAVARLRDGVTPERANSELSALGLRLGREFRGTNLGWHARAIPLDRETIGVFRPALFALLGAAGLLLAIACINVANLLLARATARRREVAVRAAIGASRGRLVRLFLTESALLAIAGAALGIVIAVGSVRALLRWTPVEIPRADGIAVDGTVLLFAIAVAALTALAFGLAPALLVSRAALQDALREGSRGSGARSRARSALVVAEVALAVLLLSGAGLLIRSVARLLGERTGVDPTSVIATDVQLPDAAYRDWERVDRFYATLLQSLRARPGVAAAGATTFLPLAAGWRLPYQVAGAAPVTAGDEPTAQTHAVDDGYFGALRIPLVRGRAFDAHDDATSVPVAIVNETMAKQLWPGENAIGKRLIVTARYIGPLGKRVVAGDEHEVVGVVGDVKNTSLRSAAEPAIYFSARQFPFRKMFIVVRGAGEPSQLAALVRDEVHRLDPSLPLGEVRTMERVLGASVDAPRFVMFLMLVFAALALALATVGIYGVLTYTVSHRRREFGIRLALGAQPGAVLGMIVREGLGLAVLGCAIGVAAAWAGGRSLSTLLYGVAPWDPATLAAVVAVVLAIATAACLAPGRRASAEDPAGALRVD